VSLRDVLAVQRRSDGVFEARPEGSGFLFGGQTFALTLAAAAETIRAGMVPKSLHSFFLRPGDWGGPTTMSVERVTDGKTFAARKVTATQAGRTIAIAIASFHNPGIGPDWQADQQPDHQTSHLTNRPTSQTSQTSQVPPPEDCREVPVHLPLTDLIQVRPVNPLVGEDHSAPLHPYWARPVGPIGQLPADHCAAIAFTSDYLVTLSMLAAAPTMNQPGQVRTVDHALWFHRPVDASEWLLFSAEPVSLSAGRGFAHGSIHAQNGFLVASFTQEVLIPS
jgi:acyl-CoA thioesterase-2